MTQGPFKLQRVRGTPVTIEQLVADIRRVAEVLAASTISQPQYAQHGRYDMRNLSRRLGGWNAALTAAGLEATYEGEYSDERLFANILALWQHYGRQPRRAQLANHPSSISQSPYNRRFKSWTRALEAFVEWANSADVTPPSSASTVSLENRRRTPRDPSLRLRFRVLQRDNFTCCSCGRSPATTLGTELHVDHIIPWSKPGGETIIENLRTLCLPCNIGKSNAF